MPPGSVNPAILTTVPDIEAPTAAENNWIVVIDVAAFGLLAPEKHVIHGLNNEAKPYQFLRQ